MFIRQAREIVGINFSYSGIIITKLREFIYNILRIRLDWIVCQTT